MLKQAFVICKVSETIISYKGPQKGELGVKEDGSGYFNAEYLHIV